MAISSPTWKPKRTILEGREGERGGPFISLNGRDVTEGRVGRWIAARGFARCDFFIGPPRPPLRRPLDRLDPMAWEGRRRFFAYPLLIFLDSSALFRLPSDDRTDRPFTGLYCRVERGEEAAK